MLGGQAQVITCWLLIIEGSPEVATPPSRDMIRGYELEEETYFGGAHWQQHPDVTR